MNKRSSEERKGEREKVQRGVKKEKRREECYNDRMEGKWNSRRRKGGKGEENNTGRMEKTRKAYGRWRERGTLQHEIEGKRNNIKKIKTEGKTNHVRRWKDERTNKMTKK